MSSELAFALPLDGSELPPELAAIWIVSESARFVTSNSRGNHAAAFYLESNEARRGAREHWLKRRGFRRRGGVWVVSPSVSGRGIKPDLDESALRALVEAFDLDERPPDIRARPPRYVPIRDRAIQVAPPIRDARYSNIVRCSAKAQPIPIEATRAAADALGVRLPAGVAEYLAEFGECVFSSCLRVYPPERLRAEQTEWRERVEDYFFWEESADLLDHQSVLECAVFADTTVGDELIVHPDDPGGVYVLPRDDGKIYRIEGNFDSVLTWLFRGAPLPFRASVLYAEPFGTKGRAWEVAQGLTDSVTRRIGLDRVSKFLRSIRSEAVHVDRQTTEDGEETVVVLDRGEVLLVLITTAEGPITVRMLKFADEVPPHTVHVLDALRNAGLAEPP